MIQPVARKTLDIRGLWLVAVSAAWMAGIVLDRWLPVSALFLLIGAGAALVGLLLLWRDQRARLLLLCALWLLLGAWRYAILAGDPHAISAYIGSGKVQIQGSAADEPVEGDRTRLLLVAVSSISTDGGTTWRAADGDIEVLMLGSGLANPYGPTFGDDVQLQGSLQPPGAHSQPEALASMAFPSISVTGDNPILSAIAQLRITLATIITQALPQPEAAVMIAILLSLHTPALNLLVSPSGQVGTSIFNETGIAHLITPSGFKVTLLAGLVMASTRWLYEKRDRSTGRFLPAQQRGIAWGRWISTLLTIGFIALYTLLQGAGPASVRAGIMGSLLVIAPLLGRRYNAYTALAGCALIMSALDPLVLWNASFLLSFLGTLGIFILTPVFQRPLRSLDWLPFGHTSSEIIAVTLAAQVATWPITAILFNQVSIIAPIPNLFVVPLLSTLLLLGVLICVVGFVSIPAATVVGWLAWPLLWYVIEVPELFVSLRGSYLPGASVSSAMAWAYYAILGLIVSVVFYQWPVLRQAERHHPAPMLSRRVRFLALAGAALIILLATGATAMASKPEGQLTITFLNVGPSGQPPQGEAVLIHTPDGKYALIDGGLDATSLAQALDSQLPYWQRTLNEVILTSPRMDHITGLQDAITRYQIGEALDAGMLHPNSNYALWQRTISQRGIPYTQIRQGMTIAIGAQVALQVFWPPAQLHKGSDEEIDNGLIVRLVAPGLSILLLGAASMSKYALEGLLGAISPTYLQSDIVQLVAESGKDFPSQLSDVLAAAHPSLLIVSPSELSAKLRKAGVSTILSPLPPTLDSSSWQIVQTAQAGTFTVEDNGHTWGISPTT